MVKRYIPNTASEREEMLKSAGYSSFRELYEMIPEEVYLEDGLNLEDGIAEMDLSRKITALSEENVVFSDVYRGAGAYKHYIPSIVKTVVSNETFITSYTPYQAEIAQGTLQNIFEFQTMVCELTGMEVANASVYDGASALAEAVAMTQARKKNVAYVSETIDPQYIDTIKTYCFGNEIEVVMLPAKDGKLDVESLDEIVKDDAACIVSQYPNYYGLIEDIEGMVKVCQDKKAKSVVSVNPIAMAVLKTPGQMGVDIVTAEGQPLGMTLSWGGPYLGIMATREKLKRDLPGRIAGQTTDVDGKRAFVLTLQAREQHIRREKARSNICSNQALCVLTANVYMAAMGPEGLKDVANHCASHAHYLQGELAKIGFEPVYDGEFFHEFVTTSPIDGKDLELKLEENGILGPLVLEDGNLLWCTTECNTKADMDRLVEVIKEVI